MKAAIKEGLPIAGLIVPPRVVLALLLEQGVRREQAPPKRLADQPPAETGERKIQNPKSKIENGPPCCSDCGSVLTLRNLAPGCGLLCKDCDGGGKSR